MVYEDAGAYYSRYQITDPTGEQRLDAGRIVETVRDSGSEYFSYGSEPARYRSEKCRKLAEALGCDVSEFVS